MKKLKLLFFVMVLSLIITSFYGGEGFAKEKDSEVKPYKTEYLESDDGTVTPVYYFKSAEEADKHREQLKEKEVKLNNEWKVEKENGNKQKEDEVSLHLPSHYELVRYNGTLNKDYAVQYTHNASGRDQTWTPSVDRRDTEQTSISVGASFEGVFEANVGKTWTNTAGWTHTFEKVTLAHNQQGEIWTWNIAENWTWTYDPLWAQPIEFVAYRPTASYGHAIYIFDGPRDPV